MKKHIGTTNREEGIKMKLPLLFLFSFLLLFSLVSAVPPVTQLSSTSNLQIAYPRYEYVKQNVAFELRIHVINQTAYKTNLTTVCFVDLYRPDGMALTHSFLKYDYTDTDFAVNLVAGNFSTLGVNAFYIQCNSTSEVGFANGVFEVVEDSSIDRSTNSIYVLFFGLLLIAGFFTWLSLAYDNTFFMFVPTMIFLLIGIYVMVYSFPGIDNVLLERGMATIFLGLGMYLMIMTGYEWLSEE